MKDWFRRWRKHEEESTELGTMTYLSGVLYGLCEGRPATFNALLLGIAIHELNPEVGHVLLAAASSHENQTGRVVWSGLAETKQRQVEDIIEQLKEHAQKLGIYIPDKGAKFYGDQ